MSTLTVNIPGSSYPIFFERSAFSKVELLLPYLSSQKVMIVTNDCVSKLYLAPLRLAFEAKGYQVDVVELPDGECFKTLESINLILSALLENHHARDGMVVALGGGVTGDMAGFAAAIFQRGISFVQIPTTLLAQVDSSVGGKTGVNHVLGKNMIGAFHQPKAVLIDVEVLSTLPRRELAAGLAEVVKYGFIWDAPFFEWIERHAEQLLSGSLDELNQAIKTSCDIKAQVVALDEKEKGVRAILNFGHTFGHAIEAALGYGEWLHGEAVALGMLMACDISERLGLLESGITERCCALLARLQLPRSLPPSLSGEDSAEYLYQLMQHDKKVQASKVRLVVLNQLGKASLVTVDEPDLVLRVISDYRCSA